MHDVLLLAAGGIMGLAVGVVGTAWVIVLSLREKPQLGVRPDANEEAYRNAVRRVASAERS